MHFYCWLFCSEQEDVRMPVAVAARPNRMSTTNSSSSLLSDEEDYTASDFPALSIVEEETEAEEVCQSVCPS